MSKSYELFQKLEKLGFERTRLLSEAPFKRAVLVLCREQHILGGAWREETKKYAPYVWVVLLEDSSKGSLNTGDGISVSPVEGPDQVANAALIVSKDGEVMGAITPSREFAPGYAIGHGHYNSETVKFYRKGTRVPERFTITKIWWS